MAMVALTGPAKALETVNKSYNFNGERVYTPVYGTTLPPVGYVEFCARHQDECRKLGGRHSHIEMTEARWALLNEINFHINQAVDPVSDLDLYSQPEHWTYPTEAGDCEDYVLLKKRFLEGHGFPAETLLITVVLDEHGEGHAVLTVRTDAGDFILDNRRNTVLRWAQTQYRFLKRQSQYNPQVWVALTTNSRLHAGEVAGKN